MIRIEIQHVEGDINRLTGGSKVTSTTKTIKVFGIVFFRKVFHYPKSEEFDLINI